LDKNSLFLSDFILPEYNIISNSLIGFKSNIQKELPKTDWIFFTSKNSVRFFFKQKLKVGSCYLGCVGRGTYKELSKYTSQIDFIGDSVNIHEIGAEFVKKVQEGTCLFPVSNISKRTIQRYFPNQTKVKDLIVYNTFEKTNFSDPEADVLIFTSPSNARAYFSKFSLKNKQKVISMGPTTGEQLKELGITNYQTPKLTGELGLIDLI
jgi:uroporphyrinogen-III synthase